MTSAHTGSDLHVRGELAAAEQPRIPVTLEPSKLPKLTQAALPREEVSDQVDHIE